MDEIARRKPKNRLPVSPKKMLAGFQLKRRNPRVAPTIEQSSSETTTMPSTTLMTKSVMPASTATPPAKPSSPSIRLMALVTRTIQKMVTGKAQAPSSTGPAKGMPMTSICTPA